MSHGYLSNQIAAFSMHHDPSDESALQFKILHNFYPTNILLNRMKVSDSEKCKECNVVDFIEHFFVHCSLVGPLWHHIAQLAFIETKCKIQLNEITILFGIIKDDFPHLSQNVINVYNWYILLGKLCISKRKYGNQKNIVHIFEREIIVRTRSSLKPN